MGWQRNQGLLGGRHTGAEPKGNQATAPLRRPFGWPWRPPPGTRPRGDGNGWAVTSRASPRRGGKLRRFAGEVNGELERFFGVDMREPLRLVRIQVHHP